MTHAQIGDSTSEAFIASLGVRNFDLCVVAIGDNFQSSLETTALLKEYGAPFVLSRASSEVHAKFLRRNGRMMWCTRRSRWPSGPRYGTVPTMCLTMWR